MPHNDVQPMDGMQPTDSKPSPPSPPPLEPDVVRALAAVGRRFVGDLDCEEADEPLLKPTSVPCLSSTCSSGTAS